MITEKSGKREIKDLQRLLLSVGLMKFKSSSKSGKWGKETQKAVLKAYTRLGWHHPKDGRWISAPALAALAASMHRNAIGGGGNQMGGGGNQMGGGGNQMGGGGNQMGGGGYAE
jgi:hypothetical protein